MGIEESDPLAISESDAKKIQQKEMVKKDQGVIIIDTNTLLKNQGNLAAAVAATGSPIATQQGLQSAYINALQQDDAYVIEAPSFIVPYVMEGKPKEPIKKFLGRINKDLEEFEKKKEENKKPKEDNKKPKDEKKKKK